jgi:hypothetical protein
LSEWLEVMPSQPPRPAAELPVARIGIRGFRGLLKAYLLLRGDVATSLELDLTRARILLGVGGRSHQLAVTADPSGAFQFSPVGRPTLTGGLERSWGSFFPLPGSWPALPMTPIASRFEIENELLIVDLPPIFWDRGSQSRLIARFTPSQGSAIMNRPHQA